MAQIETVKSATETQTDADDTVLNPLHDEPRRSKVFIMLEAAEGSTLDPSDILDALQTEFATVSTNKVNSRGHYHFVITP